ncbi:MAG: DUF6308 family protein [Microthrixaceae bacterium]
MIKAITFSDVPNYVGDREAQAREDLARYFGAFSITNAGHSGYTGRFFEHYSQLSDPEHFNGNDIAAATSLSVEFKTVTVAALAHHGRDLDGLLAQCPPPDVALWEIDDTALDDDAPLSRLYTSLKALPDVSYVKASKLLAAKRPHLVPIRDSRVEQLLGNPHSWWGPWQQVFNDEDFRGLLADLANGTVPERTSLLRVLDVILWSDATRQSAGSD